MAKIKAKQLNLSSDFSGLTLSSAPSTSTQAANKAYVDSVAQGLGVRANVDYAFTDHPSGFASTGTTGFTYSAAAETWTQNSAGAIPNSIVGDLSSDNSSDDLTGDLSGLRILVMSYTSTGSAQSNGIYEFTAGDGSSTAYVLSRTSDMAVNTSASGIYVFVTGGTYKGNGYVCSTVRFKDPDSDGRLIESAASFAFATSNAYEIMSLGNAPWNSFGASSSPSVGEIFPGNGTTGGSSITGTFRVRNDVVGFNDLNFTKFNTPQTLASNSGLALSNGELRQNIGTLYASSSYTKNSADVFHIRYNQSSFYDNKISRADLLGEIAGTGLTYNSSSYELDVSLALNDLSNVTAGSPSTNQLLSWNGSAWVPSDTNIFLDTTPVLGGDLDVAAQEIKTTTTNQDIVLTPNGTGHLVVKSGGSAAASIQLNCENNSHGIQLKGPAHSAAANYTLTFPTTAGSNTQVLQTDGSGNLSWVANGSGGSTSTSYVESVTPGTEVSSGTYHLVHKSAAVTLNTSGSGHTDLSDGTYVVVTANSGNVTRSEADTYGFAGKSLDLTSSSSTVLAVNDVLLIDASSSLTNSNVAGLTVAPIYTVANNTSGVPSLSFNGLDQQLSTNLTGFSFVAISSGGTAWTSGSDVTGALTSGTHFLRYNYGTLSISLETDDTILISYID